MSRNGRLFALLGLLSCIWAPVNLVVASALRSGFSPLGIGLVRWGGVALVFALATRIPAVKAQFALRQPCRRDFLLALLLGLLLTGPAHLLYYVALRQTQSVEGTVFNTTAPLWTALFAGLILRERVGARRWMALALGSFGAYITAAGLGVPALHARHAFLDGMYLLGTLMESVTGVLLAGLVRRASGLTVLGAESIGMALAFVVIGLAVPARAPLTVPAHSAGWFALAYLILFAGAFAFGAWATIVEHTPLSLMVLSLAIQPPVAAVIGYVARGERVAPNTGLGALVVVAALVLAVREPSGGGRLARSPAAASLGGDVASDQV